MKASAFRPSICHCDAGENIVFVCFGIFDHDIEVAVLVKDARIQKLKLVVLVPPPAVLLHQLTVREGTLRILVQHFQIAVRRRAVQIVVILLHILAVIAFRSGQTEQPLFQYRVIAVPHGHGKAQVLISITNPCQPVLIPTVGSATRLIVGKVAPTITVRTIVFAYGGPGPFAQIRPPMLPIVCALAVPFQALCSAVCGMFSLDSVPVLLVTNPLRSQMSMRRPLRLDSYAASITLATRTASSPVVRGSPFPRQAMINVRRNVSPDAPP